MNERGEEKKVALVSRKFDKRKVAFFSFSGIYCDAGKVPRRHKSDKTRLCREGAYDKWAQILGQHFDLDIGRPWGSDSLNKRYIIMAMVHVTHCQAAPLAK